ncbi:hypothetical protein HZA73_02010 [candidate division TA06 bacterium]|nr:hypothetical protein [candidate division TA06 bacterium]
MNCQQIEIFFRDNPGAALPPQAQSHVRECPDCRALASGQSELESLLRSQPSVELPPYFQARLWARINRAEARPKLFDLRPARLSLAASALMIAAVMLLFLRAPVPENIFAPQAVNQKPLQAADPDNVPVRPGINIAAVEPEIIEPSRIYPVWPGEQDVAEIRDLNIVASFYPAVQTRDRIKVSIDDRPLASAQYQMKEDYLTISPNELAPGQHVVLVSLTGRDGRETNKSWSFYLLEERS